MVAHKVKLTKIASNHANLRTDVVEGYALELPVIGKSFSLVGDPLTEGASARVVITTEIQNVEKLGNEYKFQTANSTYKIEVLGTETIE